MDREKVARECEKIERQGGRVVDYLKGLGCISPRATWINLQKEELGRTGNQITEGTERRREAMEQIKISKEDKMKAVQIAIDGGDPREHLRACGSKAPDQMWSSIRHKLAKSDPELYAKLPKTIKQQKKAEETKEIVMEPGGNYKLTMADSKGKKEPEKKKREPLRYMNYTVTEIESKIGKFRYSKEYGTMEWFTIYKDEVCMTTEEWKMFLSELPTVMGILGVAE